MEMGIKIGIVTMLARSTLMSKKLEVEFIVDNPNEVRPTPIDGVDVLEFGPDISEEEAVKIFDRLQESK